VLLIISFQTFNFKDSQSFSACFFYKRIRAMNAKGEYMKSKRFRSTNSAIY